MGSSGFERQVGLGVLRGLGAVADRNDVDDAEIAEHVSPPCRVEITTCEAVDQADIIAARAVLSCRSVVRLMLPVMLMT